MASCPALLVSAPASGQGKTLITAALVRVWRNRGLKVRAFKCGPDFLDPLVLQTASGHPVENLDLAMCGEADGRARLYQAALQADVIVVEGVMGLFDGAPSSADIAATFGLSVALVVDASGMAQTFGRLAAGLLGELPAAGTIANRVGSAGHAELLRDSLPARIPWLGALLADARFSLPERHLGLFRAGEITDLDQRIEAAAQALQQSGEIPLPPQVDFAPAEPPAVPRLLEGKTIAVARDAAFCFIYPANLHCLRELGAELVFFSPLQDEVLPQADALWLPGGYPELHLPEIAANSALRQTLRQAWESGTPMLAECGGMMALCETINGQPGFGLLPATTRLESRLQGLGVQTVCVDGATINTHTFHYSSLQTALPPWQQGQGRHGAGEAVYRHGSLVASYLHFYFPSNPALLARFFLP
jgi:cobyrinic acid a,c-diamide synthase